MSAPEDSRRHEGVGLRRQRRDWEDLAAEDLYWSILSTTGTHFETVERETFLASGRAEVAAVLERSARLGLPGRYGRALDFGCGAGRLTRALAERFDEAVGVDISARMIEEAGRLNGDCRGCTFELNLTSDLRQFPDASFDAVYTSIVLQHLPDDRVIRSYLAEFVRVLRPGGLLAFQLPAFLPRRHRLQPRRRAYHAFRSIGVPPGVLQRKLRLQPMAMRALPVGRVRSVLEDAGARVLEVNSVEVSGGAVSATYFATIEASSSAS
jgi:SAM-dependent methyltransferase